MRTNWERQQCTRLTIGTRSYNRHLRTRLLGCVASALVSAMLAMPAQADLLTSLSSTGSLSGWTTYGSVAATSSAATLTLGSTAFTLTPATGSYMAVIEPSGTAVTLANIDSVLGLTSGTIDTVLANNAGGDNATNFAVLTQTTTLSAGTYTFYWSYAAQDYQPYNDGVLFSISGNGINDVVVLASNGTTGAQASTVVVGSYGATQWAEYTITITTAGTYQISFAAYNWYDESVDPILYVSAYAGTVTTPGSTSNIISTPTSTSSLSSSTMEFDGGTLSVSSSGTVSNNFTLDAVSGNTINAAGTTATFSGVLSGSGGMTFTDSTGGGTITLTGANTYQGTTVISGVTLEAGATNTLSASSAVLLSNSSTSELNLNSYSQTIASLNGGGTSGGTVALGSATLTISGGGTYAGTISGSGSVDLTGGTLTLSGTNSYTGTTTIASGATLQLGNGTTTGTIASQSVVNNGNFIIDNAVDLTYSGSISGTGTVTLDGSETLTLTGTNSYTGTTTIASGATLQLGNGTTTGTIASQSVVNNGNFIIDNAVDLTYSGTISGTGTVTLDGSETLILNSVNSYTGGTTIQSGTLEVGDASHSTATLASGVTIADGATLAGHGTVSGTVTNTSGGTVRPGGSIGTLTVADYVQGADSTLAIEIDGTSASSLNVTGTATLDGTLSAIFDSSPTTATVYKVLTANNISGTFSSFTTSGTTSNMLYTVHYASSGTEVDIVAMPTSVGQIYGAVNTASIDTAHAINTVAMDHLSQDGCVHSNTSGKNSRSPVCGMWSFWAEGLYGTDHVAAGNGAHSFNARNWGAIGGADMLLENGISLHGILGYYTGGLGVHGSNDWADRNGVYLSFGAHIPVETFRIDTNLFYLNNVNHVFRDSGAGSTIHAHADNKTAGMTFQLSYPLLHGEVTPLAKVTYGYVFQNAITESGEEALNLAADSHGRKTGRFDLGVRLNHDFSLGSDYVLQPQLTLGVQYDADQPVTKTTMRLIGSSDSDFTATTPGVDKLAGVMRFALNAAFSPSFSIQAGVDGRISGNQQQAMIRLGGRYRF